MAVRPTALRVEAIYIYTLYMHPFVGLCRGLFFNRFFSQGPADILPWLDGAPLNACDLLYFVAVCRH